MSHWSENAQQDANQSMTNAPPDSASQECDGRAWEPLAEIPEGRDWEPKAELSENPDWELKAWIPGE